MASGTIKNFANDGGNGYCKMPDGTLIQWGTMTVAEGIYVDAVTFSKAFVDTNYSLTLAVYDDISASVSTKYAGGCRIGRIPNTASNRVDWQAMGRWK